MNMVWLWNNFSPLLLSRSGSSSTLGAGRRNKWRQWWSCPWGQMSWPPGLCLNTWPSWGKANFTLPLPKPWGAPQKRGLPISHLLHLQHTPPALSWVGWPLAWPSSHWASLCSHPSPHLWVVPSVPSEGLGWVWPHPVLLQHLLLTPGPLLTQLGTALPTSFLLRNLQTSSGRVPRPHTRTEACVRLT